MKRSSNTTFLTSAQVRRHCPKTPCLFLSLPLFGDQRARRDAGFVDIQSATTLIYDSHWRPPFAPPRGGRRKR
jgi:hypothetical protein